MSKIIKEDCKNISIYDFSKWGVLNNDYYTGSVVWSNRDKEETGRISYKINKEEMYIELDYKVRIHREVDWTKINYKIPLTKTLCNYGRERFWFICPVSKNGIYCGERVAKMYLSPYGNYFACRNCLNLSYQSRNENNKGKFGALGKMFDLEEKIEKLEKEIKIYYRNGVPTKKNIKLERLNKQLGYSLDESSKMLENLKKVDKS